MRKLQFKSIKAKNILCFGEDGVNIDFSSYGNIVQIKGVNLDMPGTIENPASNGAGKSSIPELISIGLYGKTIKKPKKNKSDQIVNVLANYGEVEIKWDDYCLLRSFKKGKTSITTKLRLWKSDKFIWDEKSEITQDSEKTQKIIEQVIGLSHHSFCNVIIFDDSNTYSFLEADTPTKRQIVENLLDLDQYREYHQNCKDFLKELNKKKNDLSKEYESSCNNIVACDARITKVINQEILWKNEKKKEINNLISIITQKQNDLCKVFPDLKLKAKQEINSLENVIYEIDSKTEKLTDIVKIAKEKLNILVNEKNELSEIIQSNNLEIKSIKTNLDQATNLSSKLENLQDGAECLVCYSTINKNNYENVLSHSKNVINACEKSIRTKSDLLEKEIDNLNKKTSNISFLEEKIAEAELKLKNLEKAKKTNYLKIYELMKVKNDESNDKKAIEEKILELKQQLKIKKEELLGSTPYKEIIDSIKEEKIVEEKKNKELSLSLEETESEIPYYEYWLEAFGDSGIRKFVIDNIIPSLNEKISEWLYCLCDGLIDVKFDNQLNDLITRKGNQAYYHNMSNGECRRINLAISQSFSYIAMIDSGNCPSLVFLDEITGGSIDKNGVYGVYNMIVELSRDRQVFVTTHNESLIDLLKECDTITLRKKDDVTILD